jgi:ribosome-associated toxin RatA of RatAB toxin-antitoxin module
MIKYSIHKKLNFPKIKFFNTIKRVRNYKNFVPWCKDSWEIEKETNSIPYDVIFKKFPSLEKNENAREIINKRILKNPNLKIKTFSGGIKVGFNILEFSYISKVIAIEPDIILSVTDGSNSNIFKTLEGLWILTDLPKDDQNKIAVEYVINFEFKSILYSHITKMFLNFIGDNIIKSFIDKCNLDQSEEEYEMDINTDTDFSEILDQKLERITFDTINEKISLRCLLYNLYELKQMKLDQAETLLKLISHNKTELKKLVYLSEIAEWNNPMQVTKIKEAVLKQF